VATLIYFALFLLVAGLLLAPLYFIRKSSGLYIPIWGVYLVASAGFVFRGIWKVVTFERPTHSENYVSMSPIGDFTDGDLARVVVFLLCIPIIVYLCTVGLPWAFKNWPPKPTMKKANKSEQATPRKPSDLL